MGGPSSQYSAAVGERPAPESLAFRGVGVDQDSGDLLSSTVNVVLVGENERRHL
jgi:hypothetical protein